MSMRAALAAVAVLAAACAPNARPRRAPMVVASAPARVASPLVIVGAPPVTRGGRICIDSCPGLHREPVTPALVIVDGHVVTPGPGSPLEGLDPNHIAEVELIRGPRAVELYGPGASAGVVLITTQHPRRP